MVAMSHQCQQKRNRTRILRYFEAVLGEPKEKHRPHPAATTSRQAQESPRAGDPQKTVVKVKRKKTRRELNRAKFGKLFRCKAPARPSQAVPAADQCRRRVVGSSRAPIPKPSHNPSWIITQNRLTQHLGIFNKKVKSMDIERLLKGEPARERSPEPAAEVAADVAQDRSCTSAQAEATAPPQRPDPRTPLGDDQRDARASSAASVEMGGQRPPKPTKQESPPPPLPPPPPTTDLARRLVRTLKPHRLVPGQSLVYNTQRQLVDILVERHGGQPGTWLPAELTRTPQSGFIAPDRAVAGGGFISPTAQAKEDSFLLQSDGSARGRLSSTASTVVNEAFLPDQVKGVDPGRRKQDAASFAGEKLLPSLDHCPPRGSPPGGCAGNGGAFYPDPWPWSHVGGLRQAAQRRGPSPPARSHSAGSSLARVLEAHRALVQERRSSPCRNPGKGLWAGEALAAGDGPSGTRRAPWHDDQRPGREQPEGGKYRPCFPPASPWPFAQKPPLDGGDRPRRSWAGEKDAANPGPSQLLPPRRSSGWLPDPLPENRAHPRGSAGCRGGPALPTGAPDWRASGLPISLCYPPSETLEWSDSSPPSWLSVAHRLWQKKSPEEWTFHRMRMF